MFLKAQGKQEISKLKNCRVENPTKKKDENECSVWQLKTMFPLFGELLYPPFLLDGRNENMCSDRPFSPADGEFTIMT